jgi:hypothetical protein
MLIILTCDFNSGAFFFSHALLTSHRVVYNQELDEETKNSDPEVIEQQQALAAVIKQK